MKSHKNDNLTPNQRALEIIANNKSNSEHVLPVAERVLKTITLTEDNYNEFATVITDFVNSCSLYFSSSSMSGGFLTRPVEYQIVSERFKRSNSRA